MAPRSLNRLAVKATAGLTKAGMYGDGGGLYLRVKSPEARSWVSDYPATSIARTFFGVTIRKGEDQPLLMGQTVLQHHDVGPARYVPFGFYSTLDGDGLQLPILNKSFINRFSEAVGFRRTTEPGLSIAVPFVPTDLSEKTLIPALLKNYFFPILTGMLEIEIGGITIKRETFARRAWRLQYLREWGGKADALRVTVEVNLRGCRCSSSVAGLKAPAWSQYA